MEYCSRCLYPANAKPTIILDDEGVCSGCRYHESRHRLDWAERERLLSEILAEHKARARERRQPYDCIIPVSGGKDSHFQVHLIKFVYGLNPLLVTYNHAFNSAIGLRNLRNLVTKTGCDLIRFTTNPQSARKISAYMLRRVGDITWHYHAGIRTFPFQVAVQYEIPLVIWGEHGFAELTGMVALEDMVEFTQWTRQEMDMRGLEPDDLIGPESGLTENDLAPFRFPSLDRIEELGVRGIYLSNFVYWDAKGHAELVIDQYGFEPLTQRRDRSFNLYAKIEDHANEVHDYLKYLKFGYGRATDDASMEIRHGRMTREEGIELVRQYDHARPGSLDTYLEFMGLEESDFLAAVEGQRDPEIWEPDGAGGWRARDAVWRHPADARVEAARVPLGDDRTFAAHNAHLYWPLDRRDSQAPVRERFEVL
jgi:N-acetyl sugar amidotransferase